MATHVITVKYVVDPVTNKGTVDVVPKVTQADAKDTLDFQQKDSSAGTMRITFREKELFSTKNPKFSTTGEFFKEDGPVSVKPGSGRVSRKTLFDCELLGPPPERKVLVTSTDAGSGGAIEISDR
jgi:hypothetical protein